MTLDMKDLSIRSYFKDLPGVFWFIVACTLLFAGAYSQTPTANIAGTIVATLSVLLLIFSVEKKSAFPRWLEIYGLPCVVGGGLAASYLLLLN